jgi:geranylgeranyl reductase family protein
VEAWLQRNFDVIIVGAGPAGTVLARELAKKGISVALLEKEGLPRYKCCAGGLSVRAAKLLNMDIFDVVENEITGATITYNGSRPYHRQDSKPVGYTVMRDKFDQLLSKQAEIAGVVIFQEHKATGIIMDDEGVRVYTPTGEFVSKFVVGADGGRGLVPKALAFKREIKNVVTIESEIIVTEKVRQKWNSQITIDLGRLPGYAWVFPKSDHLSIGIGCHSLNAKGLKRRYQEFLDSLQLGPYSVIKQSGALIPICKGKFSAVRGRAVLVGDAAGLADPLTGEGIYNAILSAKLAAPVIERSLHHGPRELFEYQTALEQEILPNLKVASFISNVFFKIPSISFGIMNRDERIWRAGCALLRGETNYVAIKNRLNALGGIYTFLSNK